jgi:Co/Zn/Cd efflux system component
MDHCCQGKAEALEQLRGRRARVLKWLLAANAGMFVLEAGFGVAGIGLLALVVNVGCLLMLLRYRHEDINMESAWICSRNDIIANVSVLLAAGAVALTGSPWPDILVGTGIALLFLSSALGMVRSGRQALREVAAGGGADVG